MQNLPIYDFLTALLSKRTISNKTFLKRIKLNNKNASKGESGLENQNKKIENLTKVEDLYRLNIGNMCVDMAYSKNNKSFNDCMLNILKQKIKKC